MGGADFFGGESSDLLGEPVCFMDSEDLIHPFHPPKMEVVPSGEK